MLWFDTVYLLYALPPVALALWARSRLRALRADSAELALTAAEVASRVAACEARVETVSGEMADEYDAGLRVVRLAPATAGSRTVGAVGVAAHAAGHALQQASGSRGLWIRNVAAAGSRVGSTAFWLLLGSGFLLGTMKLVEAAVWILWLNAAAQLAALPVERDAGRRALAALRGQGIEHEALPAAVGAAAWSATADTLTGAWASLAAFARSLVSAKQDLADEHQR